MHDGFGGVIFSLGDRRRRKAVSMLTSPVTRVMASNAGVKPARLYNDGSESTRPIRHPLRNTQPVNPKPSTMAETEDYRALNRANWDERAPEVSTQPPPTSSPRVYI